MTDMLLLHDLRRSGMFPPPPSTPAYSITDDVRETLRAVEWGGTWNGGAGRSYPCCPFCHAQKAEGQHTEDCRVMLLLARTEVPR